jgi:hypothetical protein
MNELGLSSCLSTGQLNCAVGSVTQDLVSNPATMAKRPATLLTSSKGPVCTYASVAKIFASAQASIASHTKNCVVLSRIHERDHKSIVLDEHTEDDGFENLILQMVCRVLGRKKGCGFGDRTVKFIATYFAYICKQGMLLVQSSARRLIDIVYYRFILRWRFHCSSAPICQTRLHSEEQGSTLSHRANHYRDYF